MERAELKVIRYDEDDVIATSFGYLGFSGGKTGGSYHSYIEFTEDEKGLTSLNTSGTTGKIIIGDTTYTFRQGTDGLLYIQGGTYTNEEAIDKWSEMGAMDDLFGSYHYYRENNTFTRIQ